MLSLRDNEVLRLFPSPLEARVLHGLYLEEPLAPEGWGDRIFVYTNFVASLDGRIALPDPATGRLLVPDTIANPRDWRLFQELAARADVLLTSGRYLRDLAAGTAQDSLPVSGKPAFEDLHRWRRNQGLRPQPDVVVMSSSLNFELPPEWFTQGRQVFVVTDADERGPAAERLRAQGATLWRLTGSAGASGAATIARLAERGYRRLYCVGGPYVHHTLLRENLLDALFLTTVHRLVGGEGAPTIVEGPALGLPADFQLSALYYDPNAHGKNRGQCLARFDRPR